MRSWNCSANRGKSVKVAHCCRRVVAGGAAHAAGAEAARARAARLLLEPHAHHHVRAPPAVHDDAGAPFHEPHPVLYHALQHGREPRLSLILLVRLPHAVQYVGHHGTGGATPHLKSNVDMSFWAGCRPVLSCRQMPVWQGRGGVGALEAACASAPSCHPLPQPCHAEERMTCLVAVPPGLM